PRGCIDLDLLGRGGRGHHRLRVARHGRRDRQVRTPMSAVIEARDLTKRYGEARAVDAINFSVARGEIFGLLGPNGAGKTTTILMMLGLTDVSDGEVRVLGFDPAREPLKVKARIGYLPDSVGFYDNMTAAENLAYTARLMRIGRSEREARISDALAR